MIFLDICKFVTSFCIIKFTDSASSRYSCGQFVKEQTYSREKPGGEKTYA